MTIRHHIRRFFQTRLGRDIVPYPGHDLTARLVQMLHLHGVTCVIDVGAHSGWFASAIREVGYTGRIISFEPLADQFAELRRKSASDKNWDVHRYAIGAQKQQVTMNISGNSGFSSSVLPMLEAHSAAEPSSRYIGTETVEQETLDTLLPTLGISPNERTFIKIDVQGYEAAVMDGATQLFAGHRVAGLQLEMSLTPLYENAMTYRDGLDRVEAMGMELVGLCPVFTDPASGRLLQFDAVFFRD